MKPDERTEARRLRREEGLALKRIAERLGVATSSVSRWVADIELTPAQQKVLAAANPALNGQNVAQKLQRARAREVRLAAQREGRRRAQGSDPLHRTGCMLYWAEGSRTRNNVVFTNSDVDMVVLFARFLRECYGVAPDRFALSFNCHLNNGLSLARIEAWWLARLELPASCLRRSTVDNPSSASRWRRNVLMYGTARLVVHSTSLVQSIYGSIQEYAQIDRPEWLDCAERSRLRGLAD